MATTTKTLAPTNQTITLPDMTERPNASVLVDGTSKEADAINALSEQIAKYGNKAGAIIPSGSDLDSYTTAGNYYVNNATDAGNIGHMPAVIGGRLEVDEINGTSRFRQMYYANSAVPTIYTRSYTQTGWSNWEQVAFKNETLKTGTLPAGTDLNDVTEAGTYYYAYGSTITNAPNSNLDYCFVLVLGYSTSTTMNIIQIVSTSGYHLFYRRHVGNLTDVWANWREITHTAVT